MSAGEIYASGLDLNFFQTADLERVPTDSPDKATAIARNALRILMMGWHSDWQQMISPEVLKAVFLKRDRELMLGMREAFQQGFTHIHGQLLRAGLTESQKPQFRQAQLYISNCLTLLPFSDINPYESIAVPQWVEGQWQLIDYHVVPIELTPTHGFKKLFMRDEDRVFAYGLEPLNNDNAESHLLFMGTTYPAGQGFPTQVAADLKGFETVGTKLYRSGRKRIMDWLHQQRGKVHVCGTSLGGSLSLLLALDKDQDDKISRVDALNPAGLHDAWFKDTDDHWEHLKHKPAVFVQKQGNDPVSRFGVWKSDWNILHVKPPPDKKGPNPLLDHALNYAGFAQTEFITVDPLADNEEHRKRNFWFYTVGRVLVYYFAVVPFRYFSLPLLRYITSHKTQLAVTATVIFLPWLLLVVAPVIALPSLPFTLGFACFAVFGIPLGFLLDKTFWCLVNWYKGDKSSEFFKFLLWLTKPEGLGCVVGSMTVLSIVVTLSLITFGPVMLPFAIAMITALPLVLYITYKANETLNIVLGSEKISPPACHNPSLARSPLLDMYRNQQQKTFSLQELGDYYRAKRELLKGKKRFIPESDNGNTERFGKTKKELLESLGKDDPETEIVVKASKAKICHIQQTLNVLYAPLFFGPQREQKIKERLAENYDVYTRGKVHLLS
ncbi:Uncharacterised protein [Legionella lansingensis]|uniref:Lipase n=1 Tax=Legionella lansingensis TaxID=45067 RepID=A0A0W0VT86_9GAMM|nr:hypothetical protein [Legionella lansingensis]KTD23371.1 hypothetical protein Llan_0870 [Legionella lansingensis]SNV49430.1 Uncharacterised protein [Legionella lansingensis]